MKRPYLNEKGVTLVELLAAIVIASIVIGVLSLTFSSINLEWNSTTSKYQGDSEARKTMNLLANYLTDSTLMYAEGNEFRFQPGKGTPKAVRVENGNQLMLYDFTASNLNDTGTYSNGMEITNDIATAPSISFGGNPMYTGMLYGGSLFDLTIGFTYTQFNVNGGSQTITKPYTITIKLLKE